MIYFSKIANEKGSQTLFDNNSNISLGNVDNYTKAIKKQFNISKQEKFIEEYCCTCLNQNSSKPTKGKIYVFEKCFIFKSDKFGNDLAFLLLNLSSISKQNNNCITVEMKPEKKYTFSNFFNIEGVYNVILFLWERRKLKGTVNLYQRSLSSVLGSIKYPKESSFLKQTFLNLPASDTLMECKKIFHLFFFSLFLKIDFECNLNVSQKNSSGRLYVTSSHIIFNSKFSSPLFLPLVTISSIKKIANSQQDSNVETIKIQTEKTQVNTFFNYLSFWFKIYPKKNKIVYFLKFC